jgi:hypothetical protein
MGIALGYQNWHCRQAGKLRQLKQLRQIALRESGCCPNRAGGDKVDKDCNIIGVAEWSHRSDSGLMQINGVHWLPTHAQYDGLICKQDANMHTSTIA